MASFVLKNAMVSYSTVGTSTGAPTHITSFVRQVSVAFEAEAPDDTAMGDTWRSNVSGGLKSVGLDIELNQDFASGPDADLFANLGGSAFYLRVRPTTAAVGATNPEYRGTARLLSYPPVAGSVGDLAVAALTFQGNATWARGTTSNT